MEEITKKAIIDHALEEYKKPRECCGLIIVEKGKETYVPCKNISSDDASFILDSKSYIDANARGEILSVVHSHCNVRATPSQPDMVACETSKLPWHIISVPNIEWFYLEPSGYKAPLLGRSYKYGVLDCYTIVVDWYRENFGLQLGEYLDREDEWWNKGQNIFVDSFAKEGFHVVPEEEIKHGDLILMQLGANVPNHIGIFLEPNLLLHHHQHRLSSRDVYGGWYRKHTRYVLRHKEAPQP